MERGEGGISLTPVNPTSTTSELPSIFPIYLSVSLLIGNPLFYSLLMHRLLIFPTSILGSVRSHPPKKPRGLLIPLLWFLGLSRRVYEKTRRLLISLLWFFVSNRLICRKTQRLLLVSVDFCSVLASDAELAV
jgi:uncharacterized membrane protein YjdF